MQYQTSYFEAEALKVALQSCIASEKLHTSGGKTIRQGGASAELVSISQTCLP